MSCDPEESLPKGARESVWQCINHLRTGVGRCKHLMQKYNQDVSTECDRGEDPKMMQLLLPLPCGPDYLAVYNSCARAEVAGESVVTREEPYHERVEEGHCVFTLKLATSSEPMNKLHHQRLKQLLGNLRGGNTHSNIGFPQDFSATKFFLIILSSLREVKLLSVK